MGDYLSYNLFFSIISLFLLIVSLSLNVSGVPGNWLMVLIALIHSWLLPNESPYDFGIVIILLVLILVIIGEVLEFLTGAIGTKKAGGTRRGRWFSVIGSIIGSFVGIFIGIPVPIIGSLIGALLFSGIGALLGAYYGEIVEGQKLPIIFRNSKAYIF